MPVRLAGLAGEGRRQGQHLCAGKRLCSEELRKAQIVTDRKTKPCIAEIGNNRLASRLIGRGFAPALALVEIDIEHMDLVVGGDQRTIRPEQKGAVGNLAVVARNRGRADVKVNAQFCCQLRRFGDKGVFLRRGNLRSQRFAVAHQRAGHLGRLDIARPFAGSFAHEIFERGYVARNIRRRAHLQGSNTQSAHQAAPCRSTPSSIGSSRPACSSA